MAKAWAPACSQGLLGACAWRWGRVQGNQRAATAQSVLWGHGRFFPSVALLYGGVFVT